jgi:hypothetical protein
VMLVLFDASRRRGHWLHVQPYFRQQQTRQPRQGARTVRVHVPKHQALNRRAVATMRRITQERLQRIRGVILDD